MHPPGRSASSRSRSAGAGAAASADRSPPLAVASASMPQDCTARRRLKSQRTTRESRPPESSSQGRCGRKTTAAQMFACPRRSVLYAAGREGCSGAVAEAASASAAAAPGEGARLMTCTSPESSPAASQPPLDAVAATLFTSSALTEKQRHAAEASSERRRSSCGWGRWRVGRRWEGDVQACLGCSPGLARRYPAARRGRTPALSCHSFAAREHSALASDL